MLKKLHILFNVSQSLFHKRDKNKIYIYVYYIHIRVYPIYLYTTYFRNSMLKNYGNILKMLPKYFLITKITTK